MLSVAIRGRGALFGECDVVDREAQRRSGVVLHPARGCTARRITTASGARCRAAGSAAALAYSGFLGQVDGDEFASVLSGVAPVSGERLRRANGRVDGLDFTFSAPKSVSVLWAFGGAEITDAVVAAHEHAVDAVLEISNAKPSGHGEEERCRGPRR